MNCIICGSKIFGFGHNASPVALGRCCDICNDVEVIPARINALFGAGEPVVEMSDSDGDGGE